MSKKIPLTQGKYAIVDDENYEWLSKHKWYAHREGNTFYALRHTKGKNRKTLRMHREILGVPEGMEADHRSGDGLDNREINLRICTSQENRFNQRKQEGRSSNYKGVYWNKRDRKWYAQIRHNGKGAYIG